MNLVQEYWGAESVDAERDLSNVAGSTTDFLAESWQGRQMSSRTSLLYGRRSSRRPAELEPRQFEASYMEVGSSDRAQEIPLWGRRRRRAESSRDGGWSRGIVMVSSVKHRSGEGGGEGSAWLSRVACMGPGAHGLQAAVQGGAAAAKSIPGRPPLSILKRAGIGAIAGGFAGGLTSGALHPIDTLKTKLQAREAWQLYTGPMDAVKKVLASQGLKGFYPGLPAAIVGSALSSSVYFGTYELGKGVLSALSSQLPPGISLPPLALPPLAAALGNLTSSAIFAPKEVIKQRLQAGVARSVGEVVSTTLATEGVRGFYVGYGASLLRNLPSNVISFSTFEYIKVLMLASNSKRSGGGEAGAAGGAGQSGTLRPWQSMAAGAVAGSVSAGVTTPLDVVKTRLMTQARTALAAAGLEGAKRDAVARAQVMAAYNYKGVAATLHRIWREEGMAGLSHGLGPRLLYGACFSALGFYMFETAKTFLTQYDSKFVIDERKEVEVEAKA